MVKNLNVNLSVKPENVKNKTVRYSKRTARAENNTIVTNPFCAVHLKIRRFPRSSEATMTHPLLVYIHHSIVFLRILLRLTLFLLILTRLLLIFTKCLTRGNEYCKFKIQNKVRDTKTLRRIFFFLGHPSLQANFL